MNPDPSQTFTCFVIMPFADTTHTVNGNEIVTTTTEWNHIFEKWIRRAVESFTPRRFRCIRSPAVPGNFVKGIVQDLYHSEVVIADLTGNRPNVYYELGVRHALQTGTLIITQDVTAIPSDLRSYYCFQYNYSKEHHRYETLYAVFESELHQKLSHFFDNVFASDNPVSDFLGYKNAFVEERFQVEKREVVFLAKMMRDLVKKNYIICADFDRVGKHIEAGESGEPQFEEAAVLDFFPFDLLLSRFITTRWELMPADLIQNLSAFVQTTRLLFLPIHQGCKR